MALQIFVCVVSPNPGNSATRPDSHAACKSEIELRGDFLERFGNFLLRHHVSLNYNFRVTSPSAKWFGPWPNRLLRGVLPDAEFIAGGAAPGSRGARCFAAESGWKPNFRLTG